MRRLWVSATLSAVLILAGCGIENQTTGTDVVRVLNAKLQSGTIVVNTQDVSENTTGEDVIDLNSKDGIRNYVHSQFPKQQRVPIRVVRPNGTVVDLTSAANRDTGQSSSPPLGATSLSATHMQAGNGSISIPPPGCSMDPNVTPAAGPNASHSAKEHAVISVATSKLGTPYIWVTARTGDKTGLTAVTSQHTCIITHWATA